MGEAIARNLEDVRQLGQQTRLNLRYEKFRLIGREGQAFVNEEPEPVEPGNL